MGATLLLLNGPPGIGKSSVARLLGRDHGVVVVDPDDLRNRADAGAARAQAFSSVAAHLAGGRDVVVPQLVARVDQLDGFELVARGAGARLVHVLLVDDGADPLARSLRGAAGDGRPARADLDEDRLRSYLEGLEQVLAARPSTHVVRSTEGDPDGTAAAALAALRN